MHRRDDIVVISSEESRRVQGGATGAALVDATAASPFRDLDLEPERVGAPVRDVEL